MLVVTLCCFILLCEINKSTQISNQEFVTLTYKQKLRFDEFRERVISKLPHDYMRQDIYLIRWLRDSFFDVNVAEKRVLDNLIWRDENKMDTILDEDWSDMEEEYKYNVEGCDRSGNPVITAEVGDWDLRRVVLAGKSERIRRYFDRLFEESALLLRKMGGNATQFITVMDMGNFNIISQGCPRCLPLLMSMLSTYQQHYPGCAHKVMAINTPQYALPLWEIFKNLLDQNTRAVFNFYGRNSNEWRNSLLEDIDPSQLTKRYGGSRTTPSVDMDDLRQNGLQFNCFPPNQNNNSTDSNGV